MPGVFLVCFLGDLSMELCSVTRKGLITLPSTFCCFTFGSTDEPTYCYLNPDIVVVTVEGVRLTFGLKAPLSQWYTIVYGDKRRPNKIKPRDRYKLIRSRSQEEANEYFNATFMLELSNWLDSGNDIFMYSTEVGNSLKDNRLQRTLNLNGLMVPQFEHPTALNLLAVIEHC